MDCITANLYGSDLDSYSILQRDMAIAMSSHLDTPYILLTLSYVIVEHDHRLMLVVAADHGEREVVMLYNSFAHSKGTA